MQGDKLFSCFVHSFCESCLNKLHIQEISFFFDQRRVEGRIIILIPSFFFLFDSSFFFFFALCKDFLPESDQCGEIGMRRGVLG